MENETQRIKSEETVLKSLDNTKPSNIYANDWNPEARRSWFQIL